MTEIPSIQWFPGHMAKTRRLMKECLPLVDAVVEIIDARIPQSSRNPEINKLIENKPRLVLLNKCDTSDEKANNLWIEYFKKNNITVIPTDSRSGKGVNKFLPTIKTVLADVLERRSKKGMIGRPLRIMVVGIPNVGKSSFINRLASSKRAKVEDRPGVTRGKQWVTLDKEVELLDMPGVLWPKFEDQVVGERLAFTGAVKDDVLDIEALACRLIEFLKKYYADVLSSRYNIEINDEDDGFDLLNKVGRKRGMLISGGEINIERAAITVIDEFRSGKLGRITLEFPEI